MSKSGSFNLKRTVFAAATLALAGSGLIVGAANADESPLSYGDIENKQGSVTIHKFETGSLQGTPSEGNDTAQGDGVKEVTFKLYKINVDLRTPEGWRKIAAVGDVTPPDACNENAQPNWSAFGDQNQLQADPTGNREGITAEGGKAAFTNVAVGAYLVCEQPTTGAQNKNDEAVTVVKRSAPFIVTVPRPHTNGVDNNKAWIYDVHAYPKNTVLPYPKKNATINTHAAGVNDGVEYTISSTIPNLLANQNFKFFSVIDQMPAELTDAKVSSVKIQNGDDTAGAVPIASEQYGVDYSTSDSFLAVNFKKEGLKTLKKAANSKVVVTIKAKVNAVSANKIENTGYVALEVVDGEIPEENPPLLLSPQVVLATTQPLSRAPQRSILLISLQACGATSRFSNMTLRIRTLVHLTALFSKCSKQLISKRV